MQKQPNILFIMADQLRHDFLGCAGSPFVRTPNVDRLATRGMVFTHCCTNAPVCGPARIALATGLLPSRTGTTSNATAFMPSSVSNHYKHFRDHGYRVELVGRHDLAKPGAPASIHGNRPLNFSYGFTRVLEVEGGMSCALAAKRQGATGPYTKYLQEQGLLDDYAEDFMQRHAKGWIIGASHDSVLPKEHHQDAFIGRKAVERIMEIEDDYPWYLLVNFQSPHDPFDPPRELAESYREAAMPEPIPALMTGRPRRIRDRHSRLYSHATAEDIQVARRQYCAKVTLVDNQVGAMLEALEMRGMSDNTIVVFTSDHGEHLGDHGLFIKHTAYEPSLRVPLVIVGPCITSGVSHSLVELFDLNPTLAELTGLPAQPDLDARSFSGVVLGQEQRHREHCVTCEAPFRAIRTDRYKYIETLNDETELYDLAADPNESQNIAASQPKQVAQLQAMLERRFTEGRWMR